MPPAATPTVITVPMDGGVEDATRLQHRLRVAAVKKSCAASGIEDRMRISVLVLLLLLAAGCGAGRSLSAVSEGQTGRLDIATLTLAPNGDERPAVVGGDLTVPAGSGRIPAVIVLHSCAGVTPNVLDWARELNGMGFASLVLDSFSGRGVKEVCTGHTSVSIGSRLTDAYRALALLAVHPRLDRRRIAALGFSHGGWVALWASQGQFERRFLRADVEFAAFAALYPAGCNARLLSETDMAPGPVRIFQGTADDWTPIGPCREWVARRQAAGRHVSLREYPGAMHAFDVPYFVPPRRLDDVINPAHCAVVQQRDGTFVDNDGRPFSGLSACMARGATLGYDADAHRRVIADVKAFLDQAFRER
jgi:dienelactone hydrolase